MSHLDVKSEFIIDSSQQLILSYSIFYNGRPLSLQLTELMQFIYNHESSLSPELSSFLYFITRSTKKFTLNNQLIYGIKNDSDILDFLLLSRQKNISLIMKHEGTERPLQSTGPLPINIQINKTGYSLSCQLTNKDYLLQSPTHFLLLHDSNGTYIYSAGLFVEISSKLDAFIGECLDNTVVSLHSSTDIAAFVKHVYTPSKSLINWNLNTSIDHLIPEEVTPNPLLTLLFENSVLTPMLSFEYGSEIIDSQCQDTEIIDRQSGQRITRMPEMESIYQEDLMSLFQEYNLPFLLNNPGDIAIFLDKITDILKKRDWKINSDIKDFNVIKDPVNLEFSVQDTGKDWFVFEPNCSVLDQHVSLQEIAKCALDNHGYVKTKKGFVKLTKESQDQLNYLSSNQAFKVGKTFSKRDILPLLHGTNVRTESKELKHSIETLKGLTPQTLALSPDFKGTLRSYQTYGVHWMNMISHCGQGGVLADDMGLGKTVQTLAFTSMKDSKSPTLVVCPTSVTYNWQHEISTFLPSKTSFVYSGANRNAHLESLLDYDYIIVSYGILKNDIEWLKSIHYASIIVDEAQYIKNPNAQVSKAIKKLQGDFKLAMTGTPIENHLQDIWNLFDFAMPDYLGSKGAFDTRVKDNNLDDIKAKIKPFVLRREKREVLDTLPDKTEIIVKCPLSSAQMSIYKTVLDAVKKGVQQSKKTNNKLHMLTALLKLRQVCTHPSLITDLKDMNIPSAKFDILTEKCSELYKENHKVVLFSQFTSMLDIIETWTKKNDIAIERIDGSITGKKRMEAVNRFQNSDKPCLFLISLKAGGVGLNLTAADYVIHVDPWWNPAIESQATDRVHRMGQKNKVFVYKLICEGTIEETIQQLQEEKRQLLNEIVDIDGSQEKSIDLKAIQELVFS
ncbi:hypothetical protein DID78_02720 [Candidatus Marinamargulisbacteria bacterium SCGC AG-343-D04]|nr:hypothetical protein DID78_02720 [Candidatus Marinamargulisbacteria bacterium SCGC AG-343-D04]